MRKYLQIHLLTSYPPSNLNRDDLGRPKTAVVGGTTRLRISSQSLKRAWRTSGVFQEKVGSIIVAGKTGLRTKRLGEEIFSRLIKGGIKDKDSVDWARSIAGCFGEIKSEKENFPANLHIKQLSFISPEEQQAVYQLVDELIQAKSKPSEDQLKLLRQKNSAADIALFGRMLAKNPSFNIEASAQVAHAFSVQKITIEDDFFTAVDDLNRGDEDLGAGHMGDTEFASGVFYTYINIDRELLMRNLHGCGEESKALWEKTITGLVESAAKVSPTGKQNSFGSRAYAHYIMAELGDQQPRSLSLSFIQHVSGNIVNESIQRLESTKEKMDRVYGSCSDQSEVMDIFNERGSLQELMVFCVKE